MNQIRFQDLGLSARILRGLDACEYTVPTPIQADAIPVLLEGHDLLGVAQTGTGKTAAFGLPLLQTLDASSEHRAGRGKTRGPRALILTPTRELAAQIGESLTDYGKFLSLNVSVIFGGVGQENQVRAVRRGIDVLVATPGRLLDLMNQAHVDLGHIEIFVLDEADRMLDMGFIRDVRKVIAALPRKRQTMLFSATMPEEIVKLTRQILNDPIRVEVTPAASTVERIDQWVFYVENALKRALLTDLVSDPHRTGKPTGKDRPGGRILVFTRTKRGADRVAKHLRQSGVAADVLHGNKSQSARTRALEAFRSGATPVLVATDIAARGIDIDDISHVVNFDLPHVAETYVHRIGRTARAGREGVALSLCSGEERPLLRDIEKLIRRKIPVAEHRLAKSRGGENGVAEAPGKDEGRSTSRRDRPEGRSARKGGAPRGGRSRPGRVAAPRPGRPGRAVPKPRTKPAPAPTPQRHDKGSTPFGAGIR